MVFRKSWIEMNRHNIEIWKMNCYSNAIIIWSNEILLIIFIIAFSIPLCLTVNPLKNYIIKFQVHEKNGRQIDVECHSKNEKRKFCSESDDYYDSLRWITFLCEVVFCQYFCCSHAWTMFMHWTSAKIKGMKWMNIYIFSIQPLKNEKDAQRLFIINIF